MTKPGQGHGWRFELGRRARVLLVLSALITVAGWFGERYWLLELFSHFITWYAVASGLLALLLWFGHARRWSLCALLLAAFQAAIPLSWYLPSAALQSEEAPNLTLLLANVHSSNQETRAFLQRVEEFDPDIICVQEITERWRDSLAPLENKYPVHFTVPRADNFGIAIYSRMPGAAPELLNQEAGGVPAIALEFQVGGRDVALLNLHAVPPLGRALAERRGNQLDFARGWLGASDGNAILIGDLNLTMYSPVYRRFFRDTGALNARAGFGPVGTWPAWLPVMRLPIDQCVVRGPSVVSCRTLPSINSDHLPLLITLRIAP